ncbi:MAG TPA: CRTAC1 family protein [Bryobacteraceae bacterium]|nr:CRTAC1 family protein [Bryobacteraceae bacterium]
MSGVHFVCEPSKTSRKYLVESMVGGVALFDADGDGWLDIYLVNGAELADPMPPGKRPDKSNPRFWNRLFRNNRDGTFSDITEKAGVRGEGYGMGVATGDYDNDGRTDLYITQVGKNTLFRNLGDGRFADVTASANVGAGGWSTGAVFLDYDRDGDLDLFVARYLTWDFSQDIWCGSREPGYRAYCHPNQFQPITHLLYRNKGNGVFEDVSAEAGFSTASGKGLGVAINDYDRDGWPDILVANDSFPQQLFRNQGNGKFEDVALTAGLAYDDDGQTFAGMGVDFADYDRDGWPDVFINALANQRYALFRNQKGTFNYVSGSSGVGSITATHSGWGAGFLDFDLDGWKDLFVAQGHVMDNIELTQPSVRYREPLLLMRNTSGRFTDTSVALGDIAGKSLSARGAAFGDLNNDGAIDIVVNCLGEPARVLMGKRNSDRAWLMVNTLGTSSNRDGIGSSVRIVHASGAEQHGFVGTASSYLSANDKRLHFGLGSEKEVKLVEIRWPGGRVQKLDNVQVNQLLVVREPVAPTETSTK